jgi:hypothetical protein
VIVFALMLLLSLGLCGANLAAFHWSGAPVSGPSVQGHKLQEQVAGALIVTAFLEGAGVLTGAVGLLVSLIGMGIAALMKPSNK